MALHKPGQYITVKLPSPDGGTTMRNYSLSNMPGEPWFRISVKREAATEAGAPDESPADRHVTFIQCALNGRVQPFAEELAALQKRYDNLHLHVRFSEPTKDHLVSGRGDSQGLIDEALLDELVGDAQPAWYVCGPTPMLRHVYPLLKARGVADEDLHYEFFGPAEALAQAY